MKGRKPQLVPLKMQTDVSDAYCTFTLFLFFTSFRISSRELPLTLKKNNYDCSAFCIQDSTHLLKNAWF